LILLSLLACPAHDGDAADTGDTAPADTSPEPVTLDPRFTSRLTVEAGCGDVVLFARDDDDTIGLTIVGESLTPAAHACETGPGYSVIVPLPDASVTVRAEVGEHVTAAVCTDLVEEAPDVARTWEAVSGTLYVDATLTDSANCPGEPYAMAVATFEDVVLAPTDGGEDSVTVESWALEAFVGWLPG
jgi:hypothetical protein